MRKPSLVVGGGAAGFFTALHAREAAPDRPVLLLEKSRELLAKVAISGGGRCNLTHACFDPAALCGFYPRGGVELRGPFHRWGPSDTLEWFAARGVPARAEEDGRMFPVSNRSQSVVDCLLGEAERLGVDIRTNCGVRAIQALPGGGFELSLATGERMEAERVCIATGGNRGSGGFELAASLGHTVHDPVPSLFSFHVRHPLLDGLAGISLPDVTLRRRDGGSVQRGPLLITHQGLSGPAVLKLSAWEARAIAEAQYTFDLEVKWTPDQSPAQIREVLEQARRSSGSARVAGRSPLPLPRRLWERFCRLADVPETTTWSSLASTGRESLVGFLTGTVLPVTGKTMNKDEFVTCGGVDLAEVDLRRFASRRVPGLFFAGEVLDIDGVTGGFNFQAAWTGGVHAGRAMAG